MALCALVMSASSASVSADDAGRIFLQQSALPATAQTAILGKAMLKAGAPPVWHRHDGIELGYVVAGRMQLSIAGEPDSIVEAGQSFLVPRGKVHGSRALGDTDASIIATWVTDAGTPLASPMPAPEED